MNSSSFANRPSLLLSLLLFCGAAAGRKREGSATRRDATQEATTTTTTTTTTNAVSGRVVALQLQMRPPLCVSASSREVAAQTAAAAISCFLLVEWRRIALSDGQRRASTCDKDITPPHAHWTTTAHVPADVGLGLETFRAPPLMPQRRDDSCPVRLRICKFCIAFIAVFVILFFSVVKYTALLFDR